LALGMAACIAGLDVGKMDRLPDTTGMKNEVVVQRGHRNAYDHAIRTAGIRFVEVGYLGYPGAGGTFGWQIDEAITERTAAVACPILDTPGTLSLPEVAEIAHAKGVPVIVDAAAELPPRSNLKRFIAEGADLVTYSGGKAIGGPQASGILAGRADLIASVALQHQDMDVRAVTWNKRSMLADGRVQGVPHQGFGRSMKVGREEVIGLLTALRRYAAGSDQVDSERWSASLTGIAALIGEIPGVTSHIQFNPRKPIPYLILDLDEERLGFTAYDVVNRLLSGDRPIAVIESRAEFGSLGVNAQGVTDEEAEYLGNRLRHVLTGHM
jgi:D-glucosaminate-6-phosphate ammonia-lyase